VALPTWLVASLARYRLRGHMYDRLIQGGSPDCPCSRCDRDRKRLERLGQPWDEPARAAYYRDLERAIRAGEPRGDD
jgi:hypothetical protein